MAMYKRWDLRTATVRLEGKAPSRTGEGVSFTLTLGNVVMTYERVVTLIELDEVEAVLVAEGMAEEWREVMKTSRERIQEIFRNVLRGEVDINTVNRALMVDFIVICLEKWTPTPLLIAGNVVKSRQGVAKALLDGATSVFLPMDGGELRFLTTEGSQIRVEDIFPAPAIAMALAYLRVHAQETRDYMATWYEDPGFKGIMAEYTISARAAERRREGVG